MPVSVEHNNVNSEWSRYGELLLESVTNQLHGKTAEFAWPIIDQHIFTIEETLRTLKASRNTWSPTTQLPAEILCQVFHHVRDAAWQTPSPDSVEWISITHICQHWRKVAVNDPTLWSKLPIRREKWTNEMLRRSCSANLVVHTNLSARYAVLHLPTVKSILSHSDRIEELVLSGFGRGTHKVLDGCLPSSTPYLRVLKLRSALHRRQCYIPIPEDSFNHAPCLRRLELEGCDFSWASNFLRDLTYLFIDSPFKKPSLGELLSVLERMPALETLFLRSVLPVATLNGLYNPQGIKLGCLRDLQVNGDCTLLDAMDLLRSVIFPAACKLSFGDWSITPTMLVELPALLSRVSACYSDHTISIPGLALSRSSRDDGWNIGFEASSTTLPNDFPYDTRPHIILTLYGSKTSGEPTATEESVIAAFMSLPYQNLTYLEISDCEVGHHLSKTFGGLPYLESVRLGKENAANLLLAMMEPADDGRISFPALSSISFDHVVFGSEDDSPDYIVKLQQFQQCLARRAEQNAPIQSLGLTGCYHVAEGDVDQLRGLIPDVQWDGQSRQWDSVNHADITADLHDGWSSSYASPWTADLDDGPGMVW